MTSFRRPSPASRSRSTGLCSNELEGATITRSLPREATVFSMVASAPLKSVFHTLRPSTRPKESDMLSGKEETTWPSCSGPRTRFEVQPRYGKPKGLRLIVAQAAEVDGDQKLQ